MDFTPATYKRLLEALQASAYSFQAVADFIRAPKDKTIILRHDVDRLPRNALVMARLEHELDIPATYYFRAVSESWDETIISEISSLGHEVGYHYESLTSCKGNMKLAYEDFKRNLERLRKLVPVKTVCMHGSPRSSIDNLDLCRRYDYKKLGLIAEPYLDVDFDEVFYLTDTGRRWDGEAVSVRDKVGGHPGETPSGTPSELFRGAGRTEKQWPRFHSSFDIIRAVEAGRFPDKVMMTVHPQRWTDDPVQWVRELVAQNVKNVAKRFLLQKRRKGQRSPR